MFDEEKIIAASNAEMYEKFETETEDVDFLLSVIGSKSLKILEAACGGGRILIPLARAGHEVAGFDIDDCLLEKIGAKAEGLDNIVWYKADALEAAWGSGFDVVVLAGNILFNMISETDYAQAQRQMIQRAAEALTPGGHIYIDYQYSRHPELLFQLSGEMVIWEGTDSEGNSGRMFLTEQNFEEPTDGFNILLMKSYFASSIPDEIMEAAYIDGASETQTFLRIVVPLAKPIIATIGLFAGIAYWNDWNNGYVYLNRRQDLYSIQNLLNRFAQNIQYLTQSRDSNAAALLADLPTVSVRMAMAMAGVLPILVVYPFVQNNFVKGITLGGVKG